MGHFDVGDNMGCIDYVIPMTEDQDPQVYNRVASQFVNSNIDPSVSGMKHIQVIHTSPS